VALQINVKMTTVRHRKSFSSSFVDYHPPSEENHSVVSHLVLFMLTGYNEFEPFASVAVLSCHQCYFACKLL
jgi:hypothetical protein